MLTTIPFSGFYSSLHTGELDGALAEMFLDRDTGERNEGLEGQVSRQCDWGQVFTSYAKAYAEAFAQEFGIPSLKFESLRSPKEYNFETDRIFCTVDLEDVKKLKARVSPVDLAVAVESRFTDRSGFISFYPPDVDDWGDLEDWDANQVGTLMVALSAGYFEINPETCLMESANTNGALEQWIAEATPGIERAYRVHDYLERRRARPAPILRSAEFTAHLDQYRALPGARRFEFLYDPQDHTGVIKSSTIWAPDLGTAERIAEQMCRQFGMVSHGVHEL